MKCRRGDGVAIKAMRVRKGDNHRRIVDRMLAQEVVLIVWPEVRSASREFSMDMLTVGKRACVEARIKATRCQNNCAGLSSLDLNGFINPAERYGRKLAVFCIGKAKHEDRFVYHPLQRSRSVIGPLSQMPPTSERCRPAAGLPLNRLTLIVALGEENGLRRLKNCHLAGLTEHRHRMRYGFSIRNLGHCFPPPIYRERYSCFYLVRINWIF